MTLLGNKVSVYGSEAFQEAIGGANVLVPQCPTFWMDPKGNQIAGGNASAYSDGTSYYTKSLMELIEMYKEKTGSTKVILTGCSNGGFMALRLAIDYPDAFIAVAPVAEAMQERFLSDEDLNKIKDLPMYFVYSTNDPVADPTLHEIPTLARYKRLVPAISILRQPTRSLILQERSKPKMECLMNTAVIGPGSISTIMKRLVMTVV